MNWFPRFMNWLDWPCFLFDWLTERLNWYYTRNKICHGCRFHEILHQNYNISWLQISWDITPESKYLMVSDFVRYFVRITISHGCRFHEILHQNHNIPWLQIWLDIFSQSQYLTVQISWNITPSSKYLMVADFVRYYIRIKISHGYW